MDSLAFETMRAPWCGETPKSRLVDRRAAPTKRQKFGAGCNGRFTRAFPAGFEKGGLHNEPGCDQRDVLSWFKSLFGRFTKYGE